MVLIGAGAASASASNHAIEAAGGSGAALLTSAFGLVLHVAAMVAVMGFVALLIYDRYGVAVLRKAWINLDGVWAAAFVAAGVLTFFT
jgi:uncharacterized membrane protein YdcZ (DUF606 family)